MTTVGKLLIILLIFHQQNAGYPSVSCIFSTNDKEAAMPTHPRKTPAKRNAGKKKLYRKSKYYRRRRQICRILAILAALLLFLGLIFAVGACVRHTVRAVSSSASADHAGTEKNDSLGSVSSEVTPSPTPAPVTLTVSVVGDCTLGTDENFDYDTSLNAYFYEYGKEYFLANVKNIFQQDDLTIANFEGTLTDSEDRQDKQFAFKAPAEFAGILSCSSVEAVNTANNHSHDYGDQSFTDTLQALDAENIVHFGYEETAVMDVKGIKVGLVGIYELNDHLERAEQLKTNIAKVRSEGAQLVIVIFHWGNEKEDVPDSNQTALGRMAIDAGADLVCGHHPHVLQGFESYKGKYIVYSLGNFCFGGNSYPSDMDTMIFQQTFTVDTEGVRSDDRINLIPCSISSDYSYNNYQPTPAEGEEAERILQKIQERSSWISPAAVAASPE